MSPWPTLATHSLVLCHSHRADAATVYVAMQCPCWHKLRAGWAAAASSCLQCNFYKAILEVPQAPLDRILTLGHDAPAAALAPQVQPQQSRRYMQQQGSRPAASAFQLTDAITFQRDHCVWCRLTGWLAGSASQRAGQHRALGAADLAAQVQEVLNRPQLLALLCHVNGVVHQVTVRQRLAMTVW